MRNGEGSPAIGDGGDEDVVSDIGDDELPSETVVRAVASLRNEDPAELEPLFETVDPDALDALVDRDSATADLELRLTYEGCEIVVTSEEVRARLADEPGS